MLRGVAIRDEKDEDFVKTGKLFRKDALRAIEALGQAASTEVTTGIWLKVGEWLDWPQWLREGTGLKGTGPLPLRISAADDLLIAANVFHNVCPDEIISQIGADARPKFGVNVSLLCSHAPSLAEGFDLLLARMKGLPIYCDLEPMWINGDLRIEMKPNVPLGRLGEVLAVMVLIAIYQIARQIVGRRINDTILEITASNDALAPALSSGLTCQLRRDAEGNRFTIPLEVASLANANFDPDLWALAQERLNVQAPGHQTEDIVDRIRGQIRFSLLQDGRVPRLKQVAVKEGQSSRTIMRLLAEQATTFHQIVEEERTLLAGRMIADPRLDLRSVAEALGFPDQSSFGRSFKQWFGMPPGEYRKSLNQAA